MPFQKLDKVERPDRIVAPAQAGMKFNRRVVLNPKPLLTWSDDYMKESE
jgi:hypothetical protein